MCALSFACAAKEIKKFARVVAFDFRGHGMSKKPEGDDDTSMETLVGDTIEFLNFLVKEYPKSTFLLMGHSLGGAVACKASKKIEEIPTLNERVVGLIVIDVSEGTAMEALPHMRTLIQNKPQRFNSVQEAIRYM